MLNIRQMFNAAVASFCAAAMVSQINADQPERAIVSAILMAGNILFAGVGPLSPRSP